jgi:hypothetical protein
LLREVSWNLLGRLGPGAFETISGEVVNAILLTLSNRPATEDFALAGLDASAPRSVGEKAAGLRGGRVVQVSQRKQLENLDGRVALADSVGIEELSKHASDSSGCLTSDGERFYRLFWETPITEDWELLQSTVSESVGYGGRQLMIFWQKASGDLYRLAEEMKGTNHAVQN